MPHHSFFFSSSNIFFALTDCADKDRDSTNSPCSLIAVNKDSGTKVWESSTLAGSGAAIAVATDGTILAATSSNIYAFSNTGSEKWNISGVSVTTRGSMALFGNYLYAATTSDGVAKVDLTSQSMTLITPSSGSGNSFYPIVDKSGDLYFTQRTGGYVHAYTAAGAHKWSTSVEDSLIYNGLAIDDNGMIYCGGYTNSAEYFKVFVLNSADGTQSTPIDVNDRTMNCLSIGNDGRLYIPTLNGSLVSHYIGSTPQRGAWAVRGGDNQGTNRQK